MDTVYTGETLLPGQLGHFLAILSFVGALLSAFSYFNAARVAHLPAQGPQGWLMIGRNSFIIHAFSVVGVFIALYYIITNHLFEYNYAWQHSSRALPGKYLLSCFWEGQEGSFMLWTFWHALLGLVVMATSRGLESRVMCVIALVQACLASMLLGLYFGPDIKIGSTPFLLLRHQMQDAPIFAQANYLSFITDGNGLNPLLQNYWMVIHPPVLFLGFSLTLIPFAYLVAALWKGEYQSWLRPARIWSLLAGGILGLGIMMGGAWAYESLTFGGYWAWDPVENASLVPWLTLVAGLHTLIVFQATGRSLQITAILLALTYLLVWYSTFLTRTGVLGDTSVHAFTGEGKSLYWHLLVVLGLLLLLVLSLLVYRWRSMPVVRTEEHISSREFWMFIGSFVLLLSAVQISISTSIPVWSPLAKWISGKDVAPPIDPVQHYNSIQLWVAVVVALFSGAVLFLKFRKSDGLKAWRRIGVNALIAAAATAALALMLDIQVIQYVALLFAALFTIVATLHYVLAVQKQLLKAGAGITHLGFGLMLLGILISSYKKQVISYNTLGVTMDFGKKTAAENARESQENVILFRNTPVAMGDYRATYLGDSTSADDPRTFYKVAYTRVDSATGKILESFMLYPDAFVNPKGQQGMIANPSSKHYLTRDIFTFVTKVLDPAKKLDTVKWQSFTMAKGDTAFLNNSYLVFRDLADAQISADNSNIRVKAILVAHSLSGPIDTLLPEYRIHAGMQLEPIPDTLQALDVLARFASIDPKAGTIQLQVHQEDPKEDYVVLKAFVFPYINVLWLGIVVMVLGFLLSTWNRMRSKQGGKASPREQAVA